MASKKKSRQQKIEPQKKIKPILKCGLCDYTARFQYLLNTHIQLVHTREKPHKCPHPQCQAAFPNSSHLKTHQLVHRRAGKDDTVLKFACPHCTYKTGRKEHLTRHLQTHSEVKPFSCDLCPYRAKQKDGLKGHMAGVHSNDRPFSCPHSGCTLSFKQRNILTCHLRAHSTEKPFKCPFAGCDYATRWKNDLKGHEMAHRGIRPYKCNFCPYSCSYKSNLVGHVRIHTKETPYPCQHPGCTFRTKKSSDLTQHVNRWHLKTSRKYKLKRAGDPVADAKTALKCGVVACGFSTGKEASLAIHLNTTHSLPRVFVNKI